MIKQILVIGTLSLSIQIFSQLGINTTSPNATFDIAAKTNNGTFPEGLIAPRLTGDQIKAADTKYTDAQKGVIIYSTAAVTASSTKTVNITAPGYYYFDGNIWQKVANGSTYAGSTSVALNGSSFERAALTGDITATANSNATTISNNAVTSAKILDATITNADLSSGVGGVYKGSGSLSGATTVAQGANTLAFTSTATNGFSVDGRTFSVDAANDRIGIGTSSPQSKLHIEGSQFLNAAPSLSQTNNALDINIGQDGLSYGNRGNNYGINIRTNSTVYGGSVARINFGDESTTNNSGNRYLSFGVGRDLTELMYLTSSNSGRIGVGTTSPTASLDVNGTARVRTTSDGKADTYLVTMDDSGVLNKVDKTEFTSVTESVSLTVAAQQTVVFTNTKNYQSSNVIITSGNGCTRNMISSFQSNLGAFMFLNGIARDVIANASVAIPGGSSSYAPVWTISFPNVLACADGGNSTQFDFTMLKSSSNQYSITNNGNISRTYVVTFQKIQ